MEAKELMTGDYAIVNKDVCIKKNTIVKIHAIDADNALPERGLKGCATCVPIDEPNGMSGGVWFDYLSPIPLTADMMKMNGYKFNPFSSGSWNYRYETDKYFFDVCLLTKDDHSRWQLYVGDNYVPCETRYVHQLQNALRLFGIEKEFEI